MSNAPLIYVIAQVVIDRIPKLEQSLEDFHKKIFSHYPEEETESITEVDIRKMSQSQVTREHYFRRDKRQGVIVIGNNTLIFHTTDYRTSKNFLTDFNQVLNAFAEILPENTHIHRLGLRYVDLLLLEKGIAVEQQVTRELHTSKLEKMGCKMKNFDRVTNYETSIGGNLLLRHRQSSTLDKYILPDDIFPNRLTQCERYHWDSEVNEPIGLLDYDHHLRIKEPLSADKIIIHFKNMRATLSGAFKATTTSDAKKLWSEE